MTQAYTNLQTDERPQRAKARSPMQVAVAVWKAMFLREALDRLFDMRAAWAWLLLEPVLHMAFIAFVFTAIRMRTVAGIDVVIWIVAGMLAFFLFRRTAVQAMYAVESNKPLFAYRQVRPFDTVFVRACLEAFLMTIVSIIVLVGVTFFGYQSWPDNPLEVLFVLFGLWLLGLGFGLVTSVLIELVPEASHVIKILMMPLMIISGVIFPLHMIPQPYLGWLLYNPIAHGIEIVRHGFSSYYHMLPGVSVGYLYFWVACLLFLGLALQRRFTSQLVMK